MTTPALLGKHRTRTGHNACDTERNMHPDSHRKETGISRRNDDTANGRGFVGHAN
jgi:hypothetical protein